MDWRADFLADEAEKTQEYFVYFKFLRQRQAEKMPPRRVRRLMQRLQKTKNALDTLSRTTKRRDTTLFRPRLAVGSLTECHHTPAR